MKPGILAAALAAAVACAPALAADAAPPLRQEEGLNGTQRDEVVQMIESVLMSDPSLVLRALERVGKTPGSDGNVDALIARAPEEARAAFADPSKGAPVVLNPGGHPTVSLSFDYACPYSRTLSPRFLNALRHNPGTRVLMRDTPILTKESELAAKVGVAVSRQGAERYLSYYAALMGRRGPLDEQAILDAAAASGADMGRVSQDAASAETAAAIEANRGLERSLKLLATPIVATPDRVQNAVLSTAELETIFAVGR
jgi:protein-disulfide isomerase